MSNWIVITKSDLYNSKASAIVDTADTYNLGAGQAGRVTGILADVTSEIRRKVARCNQLDANASAIPGGLKTLAVDIIYCRLKVAIEQELTQDERESLKSRERDLDRIADGKDLVDPPDNPIAANFNSDIPAPSFGRPSRQRLENQLNG